METIKPGHRYILENFENKEKGQTLQFIDKMTAAEAEKIGIGIPHASPEERESDMLFTVHDGTTTEEVLEVLIDRTKYLNDKFPCQENREAIHHLDQAWKWLETRTERRKREDIEGTNTEKEEKHTPTLGEYRVGISFNPGGHEEVNKVKRLAADLIDTISNIRITDVNVNPEVARLKALAMTNVEDGAMWAVKAATK